jgi:hypothetical protein
MPDAKFDPTDTAHNLYVGEFEIEHEDIYHLKNLYKLVYDWFQIYDFVSLENDDKPETLYLQRVLQDGKLEHHIWWRFHKVPNKNDYFKYFIKFDYQTLNMGKTDITARGQKISTNKGDVIIRCKAYLMLDYKHQWRRHPILKHIHNWYIKRIYKKQIDYLKTDLWVTLYKLQDVIKQYMKLKNPYELTKPFHPELGI